jgi:hypothetical protein
MCSELPENKMMDAISFGNRLLRKLGLQFCGPQGEIVGWKIEVVDDSPVLSKDSPGCARFRNSTIYLRRSALNGGEHRGTPFSGPELVQHEVAHAVTGSPDHDKIFDAALLTVELVSHAIRYSPAFAEEQVLLDAIGKMTATGFKTLVVQKMSPEQFAAAVWSRSTGPIFKKLLVAAHLTDADVPGGCLFPPESK